MDANRITIDGHRSIEMTTHVKRGCAEQIKNKKTQNIIQIVGWVDIFDPQDFQSVTLYYKLYYSNVQTTILHLLLFFYRLSFFFFNFPYKLCSFIRVYSFCF